MTRLEMLTQAQQRAREVLAASVGLSDPHFQYVVATTQSTDEACMRLAAEWLEDAAEEARDRGAQLTKEPEA